MVHRNAIILAAAGSSLAAAGAGAADTFYAGFAVGLGLVLCVGAISLYRRPA